MVYMYHSFLIHSSADGHLGCFHVLAMINSAVMNIGVHVSRVSTSVNVSWHLALKAFCDNSYHLFSVLLCTRLYMGCFI